MSKHIVFGCSHIPFQNMKIWNKILKLINGEKFDGIHLIGDIFDMNSLSFHDRGQVPLIDAIKEYKLIEKYWHELESVLNRVRIKQFLYGNHEDRYLRHLKLPDNKRIILEPIEERLRMRENGWEIKTNWKEDYYVLGEHLEIFHGELLGINPAKRQLDKLKKSCMFVHSHRIGTHFDSNMASFNIGWLGDKNAPAFNYVGRLIKKDWNNGFAVVNIDDNGYYYVQLIPIYNDTYFYNNKKY